jgi:diguanylate cyclase (GGDEF)-like protein
MLDIDNFKSVNDSFGHPVGDQVIKMIAGQLLRIARSSDRIFRYGGEEFCILLPETTGPNAAILAERLRMEIAKDRTFQFPITVSMGISTLQDGDTPEQLIVRADDALYQAKRLGRNRVEIQK